MKATGTTIVMLSLIVLFTDCNSSEKKKPAPAVFGLYKFHSRNISIELKQDSTVTMDIANTALQTKANIPAVHKDGRFTIREDSIFIEWSKGDKLKSSFKKKDDSYSFRIGATPYE